MGSYSRQELATTSSKRDPIIGTIVSKRYHIIELLGRGATTTVYKAQDTQLRHTVAIKIVRTDSIFSEQTVRRFDQECKTLALLKHPNIVALYDSGIADSDQPYLVMEFVDGISLKQLIDEDGPLVIKRAIPLFEQTCAGLAAAHEKGVVHRDMKPANIMIKKDAQGYECIKILDFGVAKLLIQGETFQTKTQTGEMLGTLLYMSPEQCLDQFLDGRSDVYSLGCVMFEALTGKPPLAGRTAFETMNKQLSEMPERMAKVRPDLVFPTQLEAIIRQAVAKKPFDRFKNIGALQDALSKFIRDQEAKTGGSILRQDQTLDLRMAAPSEDKSRELRVALSDDPTREGIVHFLAIEALLGTNWKELYANKISYYAIEDREVLTLKNKLGVAKSGAWAEVKEYALRYFDELDINQDSFISKEELTTLLTRSDLSARERSFISFLLQHADEIIAPSKLTGAEGVGISRFHLRSYFREIESLF